jgi:hypothetical protein
LLLLADWNGAILLIRCDGDRLQVRPRAGNAVAFAAGADPVKDGLVASIGETTKLPREPARNSKLNTSGHVFAAAVG